MLGLDPALQELDWRLVAERGVATTPIVKHLDVIERIGNGLAARCVTSAMRPLVLQAVEEALGRRIVPAVTFPAHARDHAVLGELLLASVAGVLTAPIRVMDQARPRLPAKPGHGQGIRHDVGRHPQLQRPADDLPIEEVQHHRQVEPAFIGPDIGQVRRPDPVWRCRREVPSQQVRGRPTGRECFESVAAL